MNIYVNPLEDFTRELVITDEFGLPIDISSMEFVGVYDSDNKPLTLINGGTNGVLYISFPETPELGCYLYTITVQNDVKRVLSKGILTVSV